MIKLSLRGAVFATKQSPSSNQGYSPLDKKQYYVYIITNKYHSVLYTGVTDDLQRRIAEHTSGKGSVFSSRYSLNKLVYFEAGTDIAAAILREKQINGGSRQKKIDLINSANPDWEDLYEVFLDKYYYRRKSGEFSWRKEIASAKCASQ